MSDVWAFQKAQGKVFLANVFCAKGQSSKGIPKPPQPHSLRSSTTVAYKKSVRVHLWSVVEKFAQPDRLRHGIVLSSFCQIVILHFPLAPTGCSIVLRLNARQPATRGHAGLGHLRFKVQDFSTFGVGAWLVEGQVLGSMRVASGSGVAGLKASGFGD